MHDFLAALGLLFAIEGICLAGFPGAAKRAITTMLEMPDSALRIAGIVSALAGVLIVYLVRGCKSCCLCRFPDLSRLSAPIRFLMPARRVWPCARGRTGALSHPNLIPLRSADVHGSPVHVTAIRRYRRADRSHHRVAAGAGGGARPGEYCRRRRAGDRRGG